MPTAIRSVRWGLTLTGQRAPENLTATRRVCMLCNALTCKMSSNCAIQAVSGGHARNSQPARIMQGAGADRVALGGCVQQGLKPIFLSTSSTQGSCQDLKATSVT